MVEISAQICFNLYRLLRVDLEFLHKLVKYFGFTRFRPWSGTEIGQVTAYGQAVDPDQMSISTRNFFVVYGFKRESRTFSESET